MDDSCDLDALLEELDADEELEGGEETQSKSANNDSEIKPGPPYVDDDDPNDADDDEEAEIQRQLQEMERKMQLMKEKLKNKKQSNSQSSPVSQVSKADASQAAASSPSLSAHQSPASPSLSGHQSPASGRASQKTVTEVDLFSSSGSSKSQDRKLKSPVKTQPLREAEREVKYAKYIAKTTDWCPSLMKEEKTRVLKGEEGERLREQLAAADKKKREDIARRDLADSSDEERDDDGNPIYNEYGRDIKKRLSQGQTPSTSFQASQKPSNMGFVFGTENQESSETSGRSSSTFSSGTTSKEAKERPKEGSGLFEKLMMEKYSGLRIARPVLPQAMIDQAMKGRRMIQMNRLGMAIARKEVSSESEWVTMGVVYYKVPHKSSSSGNEFSVWKVTDLKGDIKTVSLLLFGRAHKDHWKMPLNKVIAILQPKILEDRQQKGEISISVDHPDKVVEVGDSADIAKCKFKKADGSNCTNIVNKNVCDFCVYHVKRAYNSASSKRSALQSTYSGAGTTAEQTRARIMAKIAPKGKGELFAGGQILNDGARLVGKKSQKQKERDSNLLVGLGVVASPKPDSSRSREGSAAKSKLEARVRSSLLSSEEKEVVQKLSRTVSEDLGGRLLAPTPGARAIINTFIKEDKRRQEQEVDKPPELSAMDLLREHKQAIRRADRPVLARGNSTTSGQISLDLSPTVKRTTSASHARALALLNAKNASISKVDPNNLHRSKLKNKTPDSQKKIRKRVAEEMVAEGENDLNTPNKEKRARRLSGDGSPVDDETAKKTKTITVLGKEMTLEEYEKLKNKKSKNSHLVAEAELEAKDKYFDVMEKRDEMEMKMLSTFEMKTKAVTCFVCNYTAFKASDLCKAEGHRYKVIEAVKRFFQCKDCKKRTITLQKLPQESCKQCGGSRWVKAAMIAERKGPRLDSEVLSIRGHEETFLGSAKAGNINI